MTPQDAETIKGRVKLADLSPRIRPPGPLGEQFLAFLCPKCRKHEIAIEIWASPAGEIESIRDDVILTRRFWHATQGPDRDWDTLSISPSINRDGLGDKCGGWHGFITNGEAA